MAEAGSMAKRTDSRKRRKDRPHRKRRRRSPGEVPGTILPHPEAPQPILRITAYGPNDIVEREVLDPSEISGYMGRWPVVWVDFRGLGDAGLISRVGELFGIHRLALEDVINLGQRAKLEEYAGHVFIVAYIPKCEEHLHSEQLSLFAGANFVLTFQEDTGDDLEAVRERIRSRRGRIRDAGADFLAYALLDCAIDHYFPVIDTYGERLDQLEDDILGGLDRDIIARLHDIRRDLRALKRTLWQLRDATERFMSGTRSPVSESTRLYLRDCHDHTIRAIEAVESFGELAADLSSLYFARMSHRMNDIMRLLTIIATIFIPLTFITGVYGMNFNPDVSPFNMPELNWYWGYPFVWGVILCVILGLVLYIRRRGWLR
jgi:magnesium transporter